MSFTNDRFFRSLRIMLAFNANRIALGEVAIDFIESYILPKMETEYRRESDAGRLDEIGEQIEMWKKYAKRNTPQGKSWNNEAAKVVSSQARKFGFNDGEAEDLANEIASEFYTKPYMSKSLQRFNEDTGPLGLMKLFKKVISDRAVDIFRKQSLNNRNVSLQSPIGEDGQLGDLLPSTNISELDRSEIEEVKDDMARWMQNNLSGDTLALFNLWLNLTQHKDPSRINWSKDLLPTFEESTGNGETMFNRHKKKMMLKMVEYLEDEVGIDVGPRTLKNLKLAAAVVGRNFWRRRFASWVLAPRHARIAWRKKSADIRL